MATPAQRYSHKLCAHLLRVPIARLGAALTCSCYLHLLLTARRTLCVSTP